MLKSATAAPVGARPVDGVEEFDAEWPAEEGVDDPARARMRERVAEIALFDPSKEACLARKYEAAAERGAREFFAVDAKLIVAQCS